MRCKYIQVLQDAVSATPSENIEAHEVQIQDLQDAVSATPRENTEAYEVQVQDLQDAVSATPSENIEAHEVQLQDLQDAVSATPNRMRSSQGNLEVKNAHGATPLFPPTIVLRKLIWKANIGGKICASSLHS